MIEMNFCFDCSGFRFITIISTSTCCQHSKKNDNCHTLNKKIQINAWNVDFVKIHSYEVENVQRYKNNILNGNKNYMFLKAL